MFKIFGVKFLKTRDFRMAPLYLNASIYEVKKMYTFIGYEDKNFNIFNNCKQYMPETQFGMKCKEFLQPRQIQIAEVFKLSTFFKCKLKRCKHEKLKYT